MDALTCVSHFVERAAMSTVQTFVRDFDEMVDCDRFARMAFELGRYGVLA